MKGVDERIGFPSPERGSYPTLEDRLADPLCALDAAVSLLESASFDADKTTWAKFHGPMLIVKGAIEAITRVCVEDAAQARSGPKLSA